MTFDEVHEALKKFVRYLASTKANGAWLMDKDELEGELFEEMVKGYQKYGHLPKGELLAIIRKMMDNRISELTYKYYKTHRGLGNHAASLTKEEADSACGLEGTWGHAVTWASMDESGTLDELIDSRARVEETLDRLSESAKIVLETVLGDNPHLATHIHLAGLRSSFTCKATKGTVRVKPWHVADTLMIEEKDVLKAYREIRKVYAEVVADDV